VDCSSLVFSGHALQRMFARAITTDEVRDVISHGETIASYPDDMLLPELAPAGLPRRKRPSRRGGLR
jgi:hypothetical protein